MIKRLFLLLILAVIVTISGFSQGKNVQAAANYLKYDELENAKKAIDEAAKHESTANDPKMWFYRGKVYLNIASDTAFQHLDKYAAEKSARSFISYLDVQTKGWYEEEAKSLIIRAALHLYNSSVMAQQEGEYEIALSGYKTLFDVIPYDEDEALKRRGVNEDKLYYNMYLAAEEGNDTKKMKEYLQTLIDRNYYDPYIYLRMNQIFQEEGDTARALEYIELGKSLFDTNIALLTEEINIYINRGEIEKLIEKFSEAIEADPYNPLLYSNRGKVYVELENFEKATEDFDKTLELDPGNFSALNGLGTIYFNKATEINNEMNDLPWDAQDEYNELKAERDELFKKALPYYEKAHEADDQHIYVMEAMKIIYANTNRLEEAKEMSRKIQKVNQPKTQ